MEEIIREVNGFVWGIPTQVLLLGTGLFLTIGMLFMPIRKLPYAIGQLFRKREDSEGDVSPFGALMTALSSTIGTGNIAGVAAAIAIGGPGAVFWMWMTAIVGMATKYAEGVLALKFRETDAEGRHVGGPMYYIKNGLGKGWLWLAGLFAIFGILASWGTGASIQANSISDSLNDTYGIAPWLTGVVLAAGAAAVILGGITRIANVATKLVPFMAISYLGAGLIVIGMNFSVVPEAFSLIFRGAFGLDSAATGISIGLLLLAMKKGVARGIFSNESGQGSAPIAHAAAKNTDPVNQGIVAMLGTFIDTLVICTITALVILTSGVVGPDCLASLDNLQIFQADGQPRGCDTGAPLTGEAFGAVLSAQIAGIALGEHIVALALTIFAFTTILGWSYYGERCCEFLFGIKSILPFRVSWIVVVFLGAALIGLQGKPLVVNAQTAEVADNVLVVDGVPVTVDGDLVLTEGRTAIITPDGITIDRELLLVNGQPVITDGSSASILDNVLILDGEALMIDGAAFTVDGDEVELRGDQVFADGELVNVPGAVENIVNIFWLVADTLTALMAAPNLIALLLLSPLIFSLTRAYFRDEEARKKIASGEHHE
ncbi:alanine/glycine:cation symporter family protein [Parvularcula marina]|uniref:alanine/glycine:cation symporter family protein n=1 Tax=Parvularcula marina TaxID=2292771 RepID=UPI003516113A